MAFNKRKKADQVEFIGYVDVKFDKEGKEAFKKWVAQEPNVSDLLDEYAENSYRASLSWDNFNETYQCSLTTSDPKNENAGYVLVGRGNSCIMAFLQAVYKDKLVCQNKWKNFTYARVEDWD